jgi:cytochrome b involved in lipid metabolism
MKKEFEEWINWGKQKKRLLTFYKQDVIDLTDFIGIHPGGRKSLDNYIYQDITDQLFTVYPHRKEATLAALNKYIIGLNTTIHYKKKNEKENKSIAKDSQSKRKVCFRNTLNYSMEKKQG